MPILFHIPFLLNSFVIFFCLLLWKVVFLLLYCVDICLVSVKRKETLAACEANLLSGFLTSSSLTRLTPTHNKQASRKVPFKTLLFLKTTEINSDYSSSCHFLLFILNNIKASTECHSITRRFQNTKLNALAHCHLNMERFWWDLREGLEGIVEGSDKS